ncbi:MAG TPA: hypothetical protein PK358_01740 [Spirochaetota bacterium]|nr:hypothetical protein [Spirochaetota bacterium]
MNPLNFLFVLKTSHERKPVYSINENIKPEELQENETESGGITGSLISAPRLLTISPDYESFKDTLINLNGEFTFDAEDMIEIGESYFERYPDNFNSSTDEEIHIGYRIARTCLTEQIIKDIPEERKFCYRKMYYKTDEINAIVGYIIKNFGLETIYDDFLLITTGLDVLYFKILSMHAGMVKERYTGGISIFFNITDLLRSAIKKKNHS